jgi:hypothetical protein
MLTLVVGTSRAVEGWRTAPAQEDAGAARCAAHFGDVAATARRAPEQGHRLVGVVSDTLRLVRQRD